MKILVIGNVPADLAGSRLGFFRAVIARGHEVAVACPGLLASPASCDLAAVGVTCIDFPLARTGLNPFSEWRSFRALRKIIRNVQPDVTYALTVKPIIYGTIAAQSAGVSRRYAHVTGLGYAFTGERTGKRAIVGRIVERLYRQAFSRADKIFFENEDDQKLFVDLGLVAEPSRAVVVNGSGLDLDLFPPKPWPAVPMRFLYTGRLLTGKGLPELVSAMGRVKRDHSEATLVIAGPFDVNPDAITKTTVDEWVAEGVIEYLGNLHDVRPELAQSHVFVLPSHREGLPRSTMEAMATGRPIITTDAPGCRRTVRHGENGLMVPIGDSAALEAAIRWFIEHPNAAETMGAESIAIVRSQFSIERVSAQLIEEMEL